MKFLLFLGTMRDSTPPSPVRLGERVERAILRFFQARLPEHGIELIDPLHLDFGDVLKPHFAHAPNKVPSALQALADKIAAADAYIMVSPEYTHSMSPALADLRNHFGSSLYSYKPSAFVTYSAGQ